MTKHRWIAAVLVWLLLMGLVVMTEGVVPRTALGWVVALLLLGPVLVLGEFLLEVIGYGVARGVLPLASLGRVRVESWGERRVFAWYGVARDDRGRIVVSADVAALIGFVLAGTVFAAVVVLSAWDRA